MCCKIKERNYKESDLIDLHLTLYSNDENALNAPKLGDTIVYVIRKRVIAFMDFDEFENQIYYIRLFEVFDKNKGYGTKIIKSMQNKKDVKKIEINPKVDSIPFWEKLGFRWEDENTMIWSMEEK